MFKLVRSVLGGRSVVAVVSLCVVAALAALFSMSRFSAEAAAAEAAEPAPPANQTYTGSKRCASCHFEQYMKWKKSGHSKAFDMLTSKYETDAKCLKCHTTGYGEPSGYKDQATTPSLAGVTCETCHGPGSVHEEVSKPFAQVKELTPEQEKKIRDSIWMMIPKNVCVECHKVQGHHDPETPKELRKS